MSSRANRIQCRCFRGVFSPINSAALCADLRPMRINVLLSERPVAPNFTTVQFCEIQRAKVETF